VRGRSALVVAALAAWIAGFTLGTVAPAPRAAAAPFLQIGKAHAGYTPSLDGNEPIFILFLGSDARTQNGEDIAEQRTDSIHLVGINPGKRKAAILGFPRDAYVEIPGYGSDKINSAMVYGGPDLAVQTVESLTGIGIHYWALTSFEGLTTMVDDIGGLVIDVPIAMDDPYSKAEFEPGVQRLNGHDVLAFSRNRHDLSSGDFGRSENQGRVFLSALAQFRKEFTKDPSRLLTWIGAGLRNIRTSLSVDEILTLAFTAYGIRAKNVTNMVVPGSTGMNGGSSVVLISSTAQTIYDDMRHDGLVQPKHVPPSPEGEPEEAEPEEG
jgi:LCP family protein required for cell wall assembly